MSERRLPPGGGFAIAFLIYGLMYLCIGLWLRAVL